MGGGSVELAIQVVPVSPKLSVNNPQLAVSVPDNDRDIAAPRAHDDHNDKADVVVGLDERSHDNDHLEQGTSPRPVVLGRDWRLELVG